MHKSLRIRLTLWYVAVLATVLIAFSAAFYFVLGKSLRQRLDGSLRSATEVTALALNHETEEHNGQAAGEENVRLVLNTMHRTSFPRPDIAVWDGKRLVAEKPGSAGFPAEVIGGAGLDAPAHPVSNAATKRVALPRCCFLCLGSLQSRSVSDRSE
jgi:hypothetical protein